MTASERLRTIKFLRRDNMKDGLWNDMPQDIDWMIARIERLTEALEQLKDLETIVAPDGRRWPVGMFARKVLGDNE